LDVHQRQSIRSAVGRSPSCEADELEDSGPVIEGSVGRGRSLAIGLGGMLERHIMPSPTSSFRRSFKEGCRRM